MATNLRRTAKAGERWRQYIVGAAGRRCLAHARDRGRHIFVSRTIAGAADRLFVPLAGGASLLLAANLMATALHAQAGPPFRTDDPETPGAGHWEINYGFLGARNPGAGAFQVPDFDINYGLGDRIQLKYELPIAIEELPSQPATRTQPAVREDLAVGLGDSLLGVKYRFFEHLRGTPLRLRGGFGTGLAGRHPAAATDGASPAGDHAAASTEARASTEAAEPVVDFSLGTYPQLTLSQPTSSVARGVVARGPDVFLPLEANARFGPIRVDGEVGYHFGNRDLPQSWARGIIVGHEFSERTEAYAELYDQQDANRLGPGRGTGAFATGTTKQRETTLGLGGRQALDRHRTLLLLLMGGRSFQAIARDNSQPAWIAYVGLQMLLGPAVETNTPVEPLPALRPR